LRVGRDFWSHDLSPLRPQFSGLDGRGNTRPAAGVVEKVAYARR
jgi:hypothetical protein